MAKAGDFNTTFHGLVEAITWLKGHNGKTRAKEELKKAIENALLAGLTVWDIGAMMAAACPSPKDAPQAG